MAAHRGSRLCCIGLAVGIAVLLAPGPASAAPPACQGGPFLYDLPAGLTHVNPRARCTDADGDAIAIEVRTAPRLGSLSPAGRVPIDEFRFYTANADAANGPAPRDRMTFVAVAGGEASKPITIDVTIKPPDQPPACTDLAVTARSGSSTEIPTPQCADADNGAPTLVFDKPAHGSYDVTTKRYTPNPGFTGRDTMTFAAVDYWKVSSAVGTVTIDVKPGAGPGTARRRSHDRRAPRLTVHAPRSLDLAAALQGGILFTARTNEAGRLTVRLYVGRRAGRRFGLAVNPMKPVRVGRAARHILPGRTVGRVKFSHRARTRLATAGRVRVTLVAKLSDAAGNVRTRRARIALVGTPARGAAARGG